MKLDRGLRVFLGAWKRPRPGWVNVDLYPQDESTRKDDATQLETFEDGSIELILAVHLIEHVSHTQVDRMLQTWRRKLAPGGRVVVECPDMARIARAYVLWLDAKGVWTLEAARMLGLEAKFEQGGLSARSWQTLFGGTHAHRGHENGSWWDEGRLVLRLRSAGFVDVRGEAPCESLPGWEPSIRVVGCSPKED